MVTAVKRLGWICAAALVCLSVRAKDLSDYRIGDVVPEDITATIPFNVVDADATAALKVSQASQVPAIYRADLGLTNVIATKFLTAFAKAHAAFVNDLVGTYQTNVSEATIESPDFGYFVTEFNVVNKAFPVTDNLAAAWARGGSGEEFRDHWLGMLLQTMSRHIRPDKPPAQFILRRNIHVVPVTSLDEGLSLARAQEMWSPVITTNIPTITHTRNVFRGQFAQEDQPFARVLANFLQPDCIPDVELTQEARDLAVRDLVVADHFDAGQVIVPRGKVIDAQAMAALDAFSEKLIPGALNQQVAAEHERAEQEQQSALLAQQQAQAAQLQAQNEQAAARLAQQQQQLAQADRAIAQTEAQNEQAQVAAMRDQALDAQREALKIRTRDEWFMGALAVVAVLILGILWRLMRQQRPVAVSVPAKLERMEKPTAIPPAELAPYLAQTLKEVVVQGLASQRAELLEAQRMAAAEITELVHRLDQLQAPMQERLRAYQDRIQELQKELTQRTEENRELLKMKIEMMRRQLETERTRVKLN